jgi:hypothetical protein
MSVQTLTDAFKAEHPDAFQSIHDEGFKAGAESAKPRPAKASELKAAFPNHSGFVVDQLSADATMDQANAAFLAVLAQESAVLRAENESFKEQIQKRQAEKAKADALANAAHPQTEGFAGATTPLDGSAAAVGINAGNAKARFDAKVAETMKTNPTMSRQTAVNRVSMAEPDLHQAMLDSANAPGASRPR